MIHGEVKTNPEYISQGWVFYMFSMIRLRSESYYMTRIWPGLQHVSETAIHTWTALYNLVILPRSVAQTMQGRILKQTPCITQQTTAFLSIVFCYSLHDTSQAAWILLQLHVINLFTPKQTYPCAPVTIICYKCQKLLSKPTWLPLPILPQEHFWFFGYPAFLASPPANQCSLVLITRTY